MAPKTFYDAGEVQKKVTETAEKVFETLKEEGWEFSESTQLTCEFLIDSQLLQLTGPRDPYILLLSPELEVVTRRRASPD